MELEKGLELYIKHLKYEKNLAPLSIKSYERDLRQFLNFLKTINIESIFQLNLILFRKYLKFIDKFSYSNRTIIRKYSSYLNFFRYLETNNYLTCGLTQFINAPRKQMRFYSFLSQNEMSEFLEGIDVSDIPGIRNKTLMEIMYSTGGRISEISNIKLNDIDISGREISVLGKGRKHRVVYLNDSALSWLKKYLPKRTELLFSNKNSSYKLNDYLFLNRSGGRLSDRSIRNILKQNLISSGINKIISPHDIRHSFASHLLQEGAGIREIQELLGHENVSTTQIYTHLNIKKLKSDYAKFHPRAK